MVIGVGGIGLNAIQGAALSGGLPVIAVDTNPGKEAFARQFGATHFVCPDGPDFDLVAAVKEICPNGVDYVFECVGSTALIKTSTDLLDWGGTLVMLGVPKMGSEASFVVNTMYNDKTIMGCRYGSARPQYDIPLMVRLYQAGRLKLDELVSQTYALEDFNRARRAARGQARPGCSRSPEPADINAWHFPTRSVTWARSSRTGADGAMTTSSAAATSSPTTAARGPRACGRASASRSPSISSTTGCRPGNPRAGSTRSSRSPR
ncbi:MAG: zinc-binding dehydrogenase [Microthrixaceae bacterium]